MIDRIRTLLTGAMALLSAACDDAGKEGGFMRGYCSDEPICDKWNCEDGYGSGHCERWQKYCEEHPDDKECAEEGEAEQ